MCSKQNYSVVGIQRVETPSQPVAMSKDKEPVVVEIEMNGVTSIEQTQKYLCDAL